MKIRPDAVVLDTNVIVRDLWFRSQHMRVFLNYLETASTELIILEPVQIELYTYVEARVRKRINELSDGLHASVKEGLIGLPELNVEEAIRASLFKYNWATGLLGISGPENEWSRFVEEYVMGAQSESWRRWRPMVGIDMRIIPFDNSVLPEAFKRATCGLPPCSPSGSGMRDAVIWLTLLKAFGEGWNTVFISEDKRAFADSDGMSLKPELVEDTSRTAFHLDYCTSVSAFNVEYVERVPHITTEWVEARLDGKEVASLVARGSEGFPIDEFRIHKSGKRASGKVKSVISARLNKIDQVRSYKFDEEQAELEIYCFLDVTAIAESEENPEEDRLVALQSRGNGKHVISAEHVVQTESLLVIVEARATRDRLEIISAEPSGW